MRNAGNRLCSTALGSLEFAVTALGVPLIVVMGHENCGAVRAAISVVQEHDGFSANINKFLQPLDGLGGDEMGRIEINSTL